MGRRLLTVILAAGLATALSRPGMAAAADGGASAPAGRGAGSGDIEIPLNEGYVAPAAPAKKPDDDVADVPPSEAGGSDDGRDAYQEAAKEVVAPEADGGGAGPTGTGDIQQLPQIPELQGRPGEGAPGTHGAPAGAPSGPAGTAIAGPGAGQPGTLRLPGHRDAGTAKAPPAVTGPTEASGAPDAGTPGGPTGTGMPVPAAHLVSPKGTPADLLAHWQRRQAARHDLDTPAAAAELKAILSLKTELGIPSLPALAAALVQEGADDLKRGDPRSALAAARSAVGLAPDLPGPRWFEARARLSAAPAKVGPIVAAAWAGTARAFGDLPVRRVTLANLALVGLVGLMAAGLVFLVLCLVVAARRFTHDFHHLFPAGVAPLQTSVLAAALVLAPLLLRLGLVVVALVAAAAAWLYLRRGQRVVVFLTLAAIAAAPLVVRQVASRSTFWSTPAADVWRLERTGEWATPAKRLRARLDAGSADWVEVAALARWQKRQGHLEAAAELYDKGLAMAPDQAVLHCGLGVVRYAEGHLDAARAQLQKAVDLDPTLAAAYHDLAKIEFREGHLGPGQEARRRALELDPGLVAAHPDGDPRLNVALAEAPIRDRVLAGLARRGEDARRTAEQVRFRIAGIVPAAAAPWAALGGAAILAVLGLGLGRLDPSRTCAKCGRPVCRRCAREVGKGQLCGQCVHVFQKRGAVEPQVRIRKEAAIRRYQQGRRTVGRVLGILVPGAGHVLRGETFLGTVLLGLFSIAGAGLVLWHGPIPQVVGLGPTLSPWRVAAFGLLGVVVYLVGLVTLFRRET